MMLSNQFVLLDELSHSPVLGRVVVAMRAAADARDRLHGVLGPERHRRELAVAALEQSDGRVDLRVDRAHLADRVVREEVRKLDVEEVVTRAQRAERHSEKEGPHHPPPDRVIYVPHEVVLSLSEGDAKRHVDVHGRGLGAEIAARVDRRRIAELGVGHREAVDLLLRHPDRP
jgi:hypothetical protein